MNSINETEIRRLLLAISNPDELTTVVLKVIGDTSLSWEEKRPFWQFLFHTRRFKALGEAIKDALKRKERIPFDTYISLADEVGLMPKPIVLEALIKGIKKQAAGEDLFAARAWDRWDKRLGELRMQVIDKKHAEKLKFKENYREKFWFLRNQRMNEQAGRVLRRMLELYPEDQEFQALKQEFDEQWARDVLSSHVTRQVSEKFERTKTLPAQIDEQMLKAFLLEGEKISLEHRDFALDLGIAFWFMEDFERALEILAWAPPGISVDWLKAELLLASRRFIEALEHLNGLEVKYIEDPETTFSVSYLRAQTLHALGQQASAIEIMQSIVRVRPHYRSAHALILEWSEGLN